METQQLRALARQAAVANRKLLTQVDRALGDVRRRLPVAASRALAKDVTLPVRRIRDALRVEAGRQSVRLVAQDRPPTVLAYAGRLVRGRYPSRGGGVRYQVERAGRQYRVAAFVRSPRGNMLPFVRVGRARYPLRVAYGPSVALLLRRRRLVPGVERAMVEAWQRVIEQRGLTAI